MKTVKYLIVLLLGFIFTAAFAQEKQQFVIKKNSIDATIGGTGLAISFNYSRVLQVRPNYFIIASIGAGSVPFSGGLSVPHQITINFGKKNNFLEAGLGGSYWTGTSTATAEMERIYSYQLCPIIGYRKHFSNHLIFRAYFNPLIHISGEYMYEDWKVLPYVGISFGWSF